MYKKAFSLIELLIVIAIIAALSALVLPNFMGVRERARDNQRKSDLKQIQKALEMYKLDQPDNVYPTGTVFLASKDYCWSSSGVAASCPANATVYMSKIPFDSSGVGTSYAYQYFNDVASIETKRQYVLCSCLENTADSEGATSCAAGCTTPCPTHKKCYSVRQP